ncbi:MAG: alkaline phosphatase D family protein [Myxococcales bacterium]|nr:alkaline phosphatase D family protein [Myxococcales bacterium]
MPHSRRSFLIGVSAGALGCAGARIRIEDGVTVVTVTEDPPGTTGEDTAAPPAETADTGTTGSTPQTPVGGPEPSVAWEPEGPVDAVAFACGIQTGDATPDGVMVTVRQFTEDRLRVVVARGEADRWVEVAEITGLVPDRGVVRVELVGLWPDHTYGVVAYAGEGLRRTVVGRFRTALPPGASRVVRLGATSCLGSTNAPWRSLSFVPEHALDAFLLLGDTIYADDGITPASRWEQHWTDALSTSGLRDLTSGTSVVATWDDHEVTNNWNWQDDGDEAQSGLEAFRRALPMRDGPSGTQIWRRLAWGDAVELFVLDCRGERTRTSYLGSEQDAWLLAVLAASTARFKIILNSVPISDLGLLSSDGWMDFREDRRQLLQSIRDQGITGVLWVAGDVHWATLCTVDPPGERFDDVLEVFAGPAGSTLNPAGVLTPEGGQFLEVVRVHNWLRLECDPDANEVRLAWIGDDGAVLTRRTVRM